ncbi:MAG: XRE family transcriptional regulator [Brevundimonas sp.]|nr:MAG: XRE family transcriptional regulator [Brevundimonas sp.]
MTQPQIITTPSGDELVVLPRADYDALIAARDDEAENAADVAAFDAAMAELGAARDAGVDPILPPDVSAAILRGASRLTAWRKHRGLTQVQLAAAAGIGQGYLSQIEKGKRTGPSGTVAALAGALGIDASLIS